MFGLFSSTPKNILTPEALTSQNRKLNIRLEAIAEVNKSLVGVIDTQKVFDLITQKLAPKVKMNFPSIWLYNESKGTISLASHSIPDSIRIIAEKAIGTSIKDLSFSKDKPEDKSSTYFQVIETGKPIYSNNLYEHTRPFLNQQVAKVLEVASGMKLAVSVPILVEGKPIGILSAIWQEPVLSKEDDLTLFTFANQISTAIYNSQLFSEKQTQLASIEEQNHDLASLFNLTSQISKSLDPQTVSQTAVDSLPQSDFLLGSAILKLDEQAKVAKVIASTSSQLKDQVLKIAGSVNAFETKLDSPETQNSPVVQAIKKREVVHQNDLRGMLTPLPERAADLIAKIVDLKSVVAYPIVSRDKVTGAVVYFLKGKKYEELAENKKQLLTTYTLQITIALENANLYAESQTIQQNLQDALYQLKEARRQERDMIDVMGHELRTPISIVRNALVMVEKQFEKEKMMSPVELHKYLDMALESTRREITLIETLLSATKVDASRMQLYYTKVDLKDVVHDGIEGQRVEVGKKDLQIVHASPDEEITVYADRTRIQEVMDNLYSNAVKYTPKGKIEIKVWESARKIFRI